MALDVVKYVPSFMEYFGDMTLFNMVKSPWLCCVDDTFVVWPHGTTKLQDFFKHISSLRLTIQFTMEVETNNMIPFLDFLVH
jgi:hypothetical protein